MRRVGGVAVYADEQSFYRIQSTLVCSKKGAAMPHDDEWEILAQEAAQEHDPKKLIEIVHSLTAAIDERLARKAPKQQPILVQADNAPGLRPSKSRPA